MFCRDTFSGATGGNCAKVPQKYELQCLNMKYMYFGGKTSFKKTTFCSDSVNQVIEILLIWAMKSRMWENCNNTNVHFSHIQIHILLTNVILTSLLNTFYDSFMKLTQILKKSCTISNLFCELCKLAKLCFRTDISQ